MPEDVPTKLHQTAPKERMPVGIIFDNCGKHRATVSAGFDPCVSFVEMIGSVKDAVNGWILSMRKHLSSRLSGVSCNLERSPSHS